MKATGRLFPVAAAILILASAGARANESFYAGRAITFVIGFGVNTGYDVYSRLLARYLSKYIPGHPIITPQNMPGAASLTAINYLYNVAPRDGTVIGMVDQAAALTQIISPRGLRADVAKFDWIGRVTGNVPVLFAWRTAAVRRIQDAFQKKLIVSASGQNSRMMSSLLKNLLGMKLDVVTGYPSTADSQLAMERGEVDATTMPWSILRAERPDWIAQKKINLLLQIGIESNPGLEHVPLVTSLARNEEERKILALMTSDSQVGRSIMAPPGAPRKRVAELRAAFMQAVKDPGLLADVRRLRLDLQPMPGDRLQALVEQAVQTPPELVAKARTLADVEN